MNIKERLRNRPEGDARPFLQGQIYIAKDRDVNIPLDPEREHPRREREYRPVVIVFDHAQNANPLSRRVLAAPLSTRVDLKRAFDLEFLSASEPDLRHDSLLRLNLTQPFLKSDLEGPNGRLSDRGIDAMVALYAELLGIDLSGGDEPLLETKDTPF